MCKTTRFRFSASAHQIGKHWNADYLVTQQN